MKITRRDVLTGASALAASSVLPAMAGEGVRDDTAYIQALLDKGGSVPSGHYVIRGTLTLCEGQTVIVDGEHFVITDTYSPA